MLRKQTQALTNTYSLAENDIQSQSLPTAVIKMRTNMKAGSFNCGTTKDKAWAEECCARFEHAGPVVKGDLGYYGCWVDDGTGDWD